ncbi:MAG: peptidase M20, partial [Candidatus Binataceae bacterium]
MSAEALSNYVDRLWNQSIVPELIEYVRIPNKSPAFDKEWREHGYMDQVVARFEAWARALPLARMKFEVIRTEKRTPLIFIDIAGDAQKASSDCVLLYG